MSEICLDCLNEIMETNDSPQKFVLSKDLELCEECGEMKHVVIREHIGYDRYPHGLKWLCKLVDIMITVFYFLKYAALRFFKKLRR